MDDDRGKTGAADYTDNAVAAMAHLLPDTNLTTLRITMRLRRLVHILDSMAADVIAGTPLTAFGDYQVLATLRRNNRPMQPSELADRLQVTRSGMTGRLHRLEALDLIERRSHPLDSRRALIRITPRGKRLADDVFRRGQEAQHRAIAGLSAAEQRRLSNILRDALVALGDGPAES